MEFEYAIFDMDGTLVDSMKQWREVGKIYLKKIGIEPTRELLKIIRTKSYEEVSQILNERFGLNLTGESLENEFFRIMKYSYHMEVVEKMGIMEYLQYLKEMNVHMCVATGTCQELTCYILEKLGLKEFFDFIITCPEVGKDKRSPLIFEKALERIGGNKTNTIIFEDSLTAIKTATEVGFKVIGIYDEVSAKDKRQICKLTNQYIYSWEELWSCESIS